MKRKISLSYLYFLLPVFYFTLISYATQVEDIWFLFSHGKYVLEYGIPHTDFLTIHQGLHFVMQQWGFSVLLYTFYHNFGSMGVFLLLGIINFFIVFFLYRFCMILSSNNQYFSCLTASIIDVLLELVFIIPRPQIVSMLLFIITLYLLERYCKNSKDKGIFFLPIISILFVNFHASMWPMLFVFCMPYLAEFAYLFLRKKDKRIFLLLLVLLLAALCGFINPYGIEAMTYSFHSYGIDIANQLIIEMHSFSLFTKQYSLFMNSCFILFIILINIVFCFIHHWKFPIHYYFLFLGFSFMAFLNIRNTSFLIIGTLPFMVCVFHKMIQQKISLWIYILPILVIGGVIFFQANRGFYEIRNTSVNRIVDYLDRERNSDIILYTGFNEGSYLEYRGYSVYMDSRMEVFLKKNNHKADIFSEYYDVLMGNIDYNQFIQKYHFTHFIVVENSLFYHYLIEHQYKVVCHEGDLLLIER